MTKKELALKTVAELRELAAGYGHTLAARLKSGIVDELDGVIKKARKNLKATSKKTAKTVKAVKKSARKASKEAAKTVKAVKKAIAAGKKAAVAASAERKKAGSTKKTAKAKTTTKPSSKTPSKPTSLDLMKKDLQGMTVPKLKETARKLGLKQSYATKDEFVTSMAKDIAKLRAEAKKKAAKAAAKTAVKKTAAKKAVAKKKQAPAKQTASKKKAPAAQKKAQPAKQKVSKAQKPATPLRKRVSEAVKPAIQSMMEKAKDLAAQVKERVPAIKPAKPKVPKKAVQPSFGKEARQDISMPRVADVAPSEKEAAPPVELLAAIAVEPTELFVSWVLDPGRKLSGPLVLRVREEGGGHLDIPVESLSGSAYVKVQPGRHYHVDAGVIDTDGELITIRRSNPVVTPPGDVQPLGEGKKSGKELPEEFYIFTPQEYGPQ